ncbi:helix-turn-helix domain-containing protein [Heliophilum fasciatum]|uniref:Transcriptional regulator with XRE-family HTH domain n=1 Tax=Heliophilum fasciatum TaxID=35700 RepID=A0A4R2RQN9_9FIRM|nr:helix-turn-helix transcriptional regulator [Heliophilum fasciatum]MCW2277770.1 transcriptional regulator with XRE-family HTH domain [Heliophilum fasciatum]TCP64737.1 transcriptional regulator with XRE-family HTH domain [Heliophilum fasciatum]
MLSKQLKKLRIESGKTQEELVKELNMSRDTYAGYETGRRSPDYATLKQFADYYSVTTDFLLGRIAPDTVIKQAIGDDKELLSFFEELRTRDDLQLLFKQVRPMSPGDIKKIVRVIKAIEDEETQES